jgi:hypothetical protein
MKNLPEFVAMEQLGEKSKMREREREGMRKKRMR